MPHDNTIIDMHRQDFLDDMQQIDDGVFLDMVAALTTCLVFSFCVILFILTLADSASGPVAQSAASASSVRSFTPPLSSFTSTSRPPRTTGKQAGLEFSIVGVEQ